MDKLGINVPLNYDVIRHTFATQHYNMNKNLKLLSEDLGHSNLQTTARYIDSIEVEDAPKVATVVRESVVSELANPYSKEEEM
ncbi:MAG: tyrosine-type recombinase/integrase [Bacteroidaceae bacterium]|nr:tyrosine-type recombinase/integrase [Bacteroidaceae bacterium]